MKKTIATCLLLTFITFSFSSCFWSQEESQREIQINQATTKLYELLLQEVPDPSNTDAINEFLINWATSNNIPVSYDKHNNIIMSKGATFGYENEKSTILHCCIGKSDITTYEAVASIMFMISNVENHGFLRAIFTSDPNESFEGSSHLSRSYLKADQLISLTHDSKTMFVQSGSAKQNFDFSKSFTMNPPTGTHGYEIFIGKFNQSNSGNLAKNPNPIKELGDFFAYAKSKGISVELQSFFGGPFIDNYPCYAKATFVIGDNDANRFMKYFKKSSDDFRKKYEKLQDTSPFIYSIAAVSAPEMVISKEDSTQIFSLLYTMINGSFLKDNENKTVASTTISTISTKNNTLKLSVCARAKEENTLYEIDKTLNIISSLNDAKLVKLNDFPAWHVDLESELYKEFYNLFYYDMDKEIDTKNTLKASPMAIFKSKAPNLDCLVMSVNLRNNAMELEALEKLLSNDYNGK